MPPQESSQPLQPIVQSVSQPLSSPTIPVPHKRGCRWYLMIVLIFVTSLTGFFLMLIITVSVFAKDLPSVNHYALLSQDAWDVNQSNLYDDLNQIKDQVKLSSEISEFIQNESWDGEVVQQILTDNAQIFEKLDQAAIKTTYHDPFYTRDLIDFSLEQPRLSGYQTIAKINTLRALHQIKTGNQEAGINTLLNTLALGEAFETSGDSIITTLIGNSIKLTALNGMQSIVPELKLTLEQTNQLNQKLNKYTGKSNGLVGGLKYEYANGVQIIDTIKAGEIEKMGYGNSALINSLVGILAKNNYYFKPNQTKQMLADMYHDQVRTAETACADIPPSSVKRHPFSSSLFLQENGLGKLIHNLSAVSYTSSIERKCLVDFEVYVTQLLLALRSYQEVNKVLPASLQELIPTYFSVLPADPYDGQAIKYSLEEKTLYSIKKNQLSRQTESVDLPVEFIQNIPF